MTSDELFEYLEQSFEWDVAKARKNWVKHQILFTEAATVFFDLSAVYYEGVEHSSDEQRYTIIGRSLHSGVLLVVHVYRGERIRIISARTAKPLERRRYEHQLGR